MAGRGGGRGGGRGNITMTAAALNALIAELVALGIVAHNGQQGGNSNNLIPLYLELSHKRP